MALLYGLVSVYEKVDTNKKIVSIVDNEIDITVLFKDALCTKMKDFSVVSFNEPGDSIILKKIETNTP